MLKEVYLDALRNKDAKVSKIRDSNHDSIISEALTRWINYTPKSIKCSTAGVDSSWNKRAFQGLNLYVVDAVAVSSSNKILAAKYESELADSARQDALESKAMQMELLVSEKAAESGSIDLVCVDGSVVPRVRNLSHSMAMELLRRYGDAVFVSKSSESRSQFGSLGSRAGDIYYFGHASMGHAGYSRPVPLESDKPTLFEIYARLKDNTPVIRLEIPRGRFESRPEDLLDMLCYHSVSGYPYCLKLAHNRCKISNEDIDRLASIFSLQHEAGARDPLNE